MAETQEMEIQKEEITNPEGVERTRDCQCFVPRTDIYEVEDQLVIAADVPGADQDGIEITLEKNILTINAYVVPQEYEDYGLAVAEYEVGDFQRSFRISDEIDQEKINASITNGVLRVFLPKITEAHSRKIAVKTA